MHLSAYPEFNSRCSFRYWGTPVHKNFNLQTFWLANKSIWWTLFFFCKLFIRRQTWPYLSHMNTHVANFSKTVEQFKFMNHWDRRRPGCQAVCCETAACEAKSAVEILVIWKQNEHVIPAEESHRKWAETPKSLWGLHPSVQEAQACLFKSFWLHYSPPPLLNVEL